MLSLDDTHACHRFKPSNAGRERWSPRLHRDVDVIDIPCENRAKYNKFRALILGSLILLNIKLDQLDSFTFIYKNSWNVPTVLYVLQKNYNDLFDLKYELRIVTMVTEAASSLAQ